LGCSSRAALKLHVSQPALSRQIRDLEDELGFPLLERSAKSVSLTEAGRVFATQARAVLDRAKEAVKSARAVARGEGGELHLGYAPSPTAELLSRTLHAFQNVVPGVSVVLHDNSTEENLRGLRDRTLHVALVVQPCDESMAGLNFEPLQSFPICVAVAPSHPLARVTTVSLERLLKEKARGLFALRLRRLPRDAGCDLRADGSRAGHRAGMRQRREPYCRRGSAPRRSPRPKRHSLPGRWPTETATRPSRPRAIDRGLRARHLAGQSSNQTTHCDVEDVGTLIGDTKQLDAVGAPVSDPARWRVS